MGGFRDYLRMIMGWWNGQQAEAGGGVCAAATLAPSVLATPTLTASVTAVPYLRRCEV